MGSLPAKLTHYLSRRLFLLLLALLLTACAQPANPPEEPSAEVIEMIYQDLEVVLTNELRQWPILDFNIEDFSLGISAKLPLSQSDIDGGITQKWCFGIDYVVSTQVFETTTNLHAVYLATERTGSWAVEISKDWGRFENYEWDYKYVVARCILLN